ncbi:MAG: AraC family transcriptional regulator [Bacteroidetes bacterium]|nr:AraC family transcriptional regulator [Bacteroidota bacterium]
MNATHYRPSVSLQPFIRNFLIIEATEDMENKLLPDTSIVMAFCFNFPETATCSVISGISGSVRHVRYAKGVKTLLVIFNEAGAASLIKHPLHELYGTYTSLDNLLPMAAVAEIEDRLHEVSTDVQKIEIVENFLVRLLANREQDIPVHLAIQCIKNSKGLVDIKQLANSVFLSLDAFEKRFRRITGTTPKHFSSIVKFRNAVTLYQTSQNMMHAAHGAGYFDQSHFIRNVKRFTGQAPVDFFNSGRFW